MRRALVGTIMLALPLVGCESDEVLVPVDGPAPPRALDAYYFGGVVTVTWELASSWDGETFRVYSRRVTDSDYFSIAEVTSCGSGFCSYEDRNILPGQTYEYYVAAVDPASGIETASDYSVEVSVPQPVPPPGPGGAGDRGAGRGQLPALALQRPRGVRLLLLPGVLRER